VCERETERKRLLAEQISRHFRARRQHLQSFDPRILVYVVLYDSGKVPVEHPLLSRHPSQTGPASVTEWSRPDSTQCQSLALTVVCVSYSLFSGLSERERARERARERQRGREKVCVRERGGVCVCVFERERERERESLCLCERERGRESARWKELAGVFGGIDAGTWLGLGTPTTIPLGKTTPCRMTGVTLHTHSIYVYSPIWFMRTPFRLLEESVRLSRKEYGAHKTVQAMFWPRLSFKSPERLLSCRPFTRQRIW